MKEMCPCFPAMVLFHSIACIPSCDLFSQRKQEIIELLHIVTPSYVSLRGDNGNTALHHASRCGFLKLAKFQDEDVNMDVKSRNARSRTPIFYASCTSSEKPLNIWTRGVEKTVWMIERRCGFYKSQGTESIKSDVGTRGWS